MARPQCPNAELAVGWALHAVEPADEDLMVEHLPGCHICREAVQRTEEVIASLAPASPQVKPGPELRVEVMAAAATTPQTPKERRTAHWLRPSGVPEGRSITVGWHPDRGTGAEDPPAQPPSPRRYAVFGRLQLVMLLVTLVIAAVGIGTLVNRQARDSAHYRQQFDYIVGQIRQPGATYAVLYGLNREPLAGVMVVGGRHEVLPYKLVPNPTRDSTYVLWGVDGDRRVPLGKFDVSPADRGLRRPVGSPVRAGETYRVYAITIEPGRDVPPMPGVTVASGQVAS